MTFSLWAVSALSNFSVFDFATKQSSQRAFLKKTTPPSALHFGSFVHDTTPRWLLVACMYRRCLLPLGAYVTRPPSKSRLSDHGIQRYHGQRGKMQHGRPDTDTISLQLTFLYTHTACMAAWRFLLLAIWHSAVCARVC
jgi:hypothetical protein